jgi:hypothetical protein
MLAGFLTNVSPGTGNALAYSMLAVVAIWLVTGPLIVYYYWKKGKSSAAPTASP